MSQETQQNIKSGLNTQNTVKDQGNSQSNSQATKGEAYQAELDAKKNEPAFAMEPIENTPFQLIKNEEGWFIAWANYRLTTTWKTKEEAMHLFAINQYEIIGAYIFALLDTREKMQAEHN